MRSFYLCGLSILLSLSAFAQIQTIDTRKFIEVTGSAEMNISPDELELEIQLKEYDRSAKKVMLTDVNDQFYRILKKHHIDTAGVSFLRSSEFYWWYWWTYRDKYYQSRTVMLKLGAATNILKLVEDLNEKWVENIRISSSSHSKIYEYRKQVKKEAAKMAKEKAGYLLESLGEELGNVLSVEEVPEANKNEWWSNRASLYSNVAVTASGDGNGDANAISGVTNIKLRYEVKVKFAIR